MGMLDAFPENLIELPGGAHARESGSARSSLMSAFAAGEDSSDHIKIDITPEPRNRCSSEVQKKARAAAAIDLGIDQPQPSAKSKKAKSGKCCCCCCILSLLLLTALPFVIWYLITQGYFPISLGYQVLQPASDCGIQSLNECSETMSCSC